MARTSCVRVQITAKDRAMTWHDFVSSPRSRRRDTVARSPIVCLRLHVFGFHISWACGSVCAVDVNTLHTHSTTHRLWSSFILNKLYAECLTSKTQTNTPKQGLCIDMTWLIFVDPHVRLKWKHKDHCDQVSELGFKVCASSYLHCHARGRRDRRFRSGCRCPMEWLVLCTRDHWIFLI